MLEGVSILPFHGENIITLREYRYPIRSWQTELPGGLIDPGETPEQAAVRELKEETGYTAEHFHYMGSINPSVAYTEEVIHLYAATGLIPGEADPDEDEALELVEYDFGEAYKMAASGKLVDAKTIAAVFMAKEQLDIK